MTVSDEYNELFMNTNQPGSDRANSFFRRDWCKGSKSFIFPPDDPVKIPPFTETPFKGLVRVLLPGFAPDFNETFFAFYDNFMIAGSSYVTVSNCFMSQYPEQDSRK